MSALPGIRMKNPAHPGGFLKHEIIADLCLTVTAAAQALGVTRPALSALLNERAMILTGRIAGLNDVIGYHAETPAELVEAFHEAVDDYLDLCAKTGRKPDKPFDGNVMFRLPPELHSRIAREVQLAGKSLNQWAEAELETATGRARRA